MSNRETIERVIKREAAGHQRRGMTEAAARAKAWDDHPELVELSRKVDKAARKPPATGPGTLGDRIDKAVDTWAMLQQHSNPEDYRLPIGTIRVRLWGSELGKRLRDLQRSPVAGEQFTKAKVGTDPAIVDFLEKWGG